MQMKYAANLRFCVWGRHRVVFIRGLPLLLAELTILGLQRICKTGQYDSVSVNIMALRSCHRAQCNISHFWVKNLENVNFY